MRSVNRQSVTPRSVPRSKRNYPLTHLSSMKAGVVHPIAFIPMLREDSLTGRLDFAVEMLETKELLINRVRCRVSAHVVPWLAFPRFEGSRDQFDRSWMGKSKTETDATVVPFFETHPWAAAGTHEIYDAAGYHGVVGAATNTMFRESYNLTHNWRLRNVSKQLTQRLMTDTSLAPAFWHHHGFEHVVDDFDLAQKHGEVALTVVESKMPVKGIGLNGTAQTAQTINGVRSSEGEIVNYDAAWQIRSDLDTLGTGSAWAAIKQQGNGHPDIWAELQENGISVSLANLKLAAKMQSFAELRKRYEGHDDEDLIDMLMAGLTIDDQWLKDPLFVTETMATFSQAKRYSSTAGQLDDSAVSGVATGSIRVRVPRLATGGVVVITCEVLPDQLFERRKDPFLFATDVEHLPDAYIDALDEIKVSVVKNGDVDTSHSVPNDTFGYAPLNHEWNQPHVHIGSDFLRPSAVTATDTYRQRIYAVEAVDPVLTEDFFIASSGIHNKPFLNDSPTAKNFQIQAQGNFVLDGLTQFGGMLIEATGNYEAVQADVPPAITKG